MENRCDGGQRGIIGSSRMVLRLCTGIDCLPPAVRCGLWPLWTMNNPGRVACWSHMEALRDNMYCIAHAFLAFMAMAAQPTQVPDTIIFVSCSGHLARARSNPLMFEAAGSWGYLDWPHSLNDKEITVLRLPFEGVITTWQRKLLKRKGCDDLLFVLSIDCWGQ